jgi:hypothetical protein
VHNLSKRHVWLNVVVEPKVSIFELVKLEGCRVAGELPGQRFLINGVKHSCLFSFSVCSLTFSVTP